MLTFLFMMQRRQIKKGYLISNVFCSFLQLLSSVQLDDDLTERRQDRLSECERLTVLDEKKIVSLATILIPLKESKTRFFRQSTL